MMSLISLREKRVRIKETWGIEVPKRLVFDIPYTELSNDKKQYLAEIFYNDDKVAQKNISLAIGHGLSLGHSYLIINNPDVLVTDINLANSNGDIVARGVLVGVGSNEDKHGYISFTNDLAVESNKKTPLFLVNLRKVIATVLVLIGIGYLLSQISDKLDDPSLRGNFMILDAIFYIWFFLGLAQYVVILANRSYKYLSLTFVLAWIVMAMISLTYIVASDYMTQNHNTSISDLPALLFFFGWPIVGVVEMVSSDYINDALRRLKTNFKTKFSTV